jgi:hypothetical protein
VEDITTKYIKCFETIWRQAPAECCTDTGVEEGPYFNPLKTKRICFI